MDRKLAVAATLVKNYLDRPYREMVKTGCSDVEIAGAFISLAYFILRSRRSAENAANTFDALAELDRQRHETRRRAAANRSTLH